MAATSCRSLRENPFTIATLPTNPPIVLQIFLIARTSKDSLISHIITKSPTLASGSQPLIRSSVDSTLIVSHSPQIYTISVMAEEKLGHLASSNLYTDSARMWWGP